MSEGSTAAPEVARCDQLGPGELEELLAPYGIAVEWVAPDASIGGSFWGDPEAGILGSRVLVRGDTPVHSALHEACHLICMGAERRRTVDTDAGGDDLEEAAVCYLQLLLAARLQVGRERLMADMDAWGYSFRAGSTSDWFGGDAEDARAWLQERGLAAGACEGDRYNRRPGSD